MVRSQQATMGRRRRRRQGLDPHGAVMRCASIFTYKQQFDDQDVTTGYEINEKHSIQLGAVV